MYKASLEKNPSKDVFFYIAIYNIREKHDKRV